LRRINELIEHTREEIREKHPKIYSKELVDNKNQEAFLI